MASSYQDLRSSDIETVRLQIRDGSYHGHTAGLGDGHLQTNLAIMSESYALDFMRFCQRNPKPCPLVGVSDTGNPMMFTLGRHIDIRTDVPAYNIYRNGVLAGDTTDISDLWQDDFVAFALGCSFTFERAVQSAGISLWHIDNNKTVPMYRANIDTAPAGPFSGKMVVSMRMVPDARVTEVIELSRRYPHAHGAPVHVGDPAQIGIHEIASPEWGDPVPQVPGETPVFWACGVTPQVAIETAKLPIFITHKPGHMLITDIDEQAEVPNYQTTKNQHGEIA